jgi:hypothetical protein
MGNEDFEATLDKLDRMFEEATTHLRQGHLDKAEEHCVELLRRTTDLKGPDDRATLVAAANLASVFWRQGRYPEAEKIQQDLVGNSEKLFGWVDPGTRRIAHDLVATYQDQRKLPEAKALAIKLLRHQQEIPEIRSSEALMTRLKLAQIAHSQGMFQEAPRIR